MRPALLAAAVLLLATACTRRDEPTPADLVFFATEQGITVADAGGAVIATDATVASTDWRRLYTVRGDELVSVDPATNRRLAATTVPRGLTARVVSTSGARVALTETDAGPRTRTRVVVADPAGAQPARELDLAGNFEPEAFAADDAYLFVLEYLPADAPERYRVRRVELATGEVQPLLLRDKSLVPPGAEEEMRGEGRQAVLSPDHSRLYTLYLHQGEHQHTRDLLPGSHATEGPLVHAFVHVLSLTEGWAYCLDLPSPFGEHPAAAHALTISPDGGRLYLGEMTTNQVAVADTESLTLTRVATLTDEPGTTPASMATSPDGETLYLGAGNLLRRVDAVTLEERERWALPAPIRGIATHPDGDHLYVGQAEQVARVDTTTGEVSDTFPATDLRTVQVTSDRW
jgi:DNA-binding beta-propeller fold protein YncE